MNYTEINTNEHDTLTEIFEEFENNLSIGMNENATSADQIKVYINDINNDVNMPSARYINLEKGALLEITKDFVNYYYLFETEKDCIEYCENLEKENPTIQYQIEEMKRKLKKLQNKFDIEVEINEDKDDYDLQICVKYSGLYLPFDYDVAKYVDNVITEVDKFDDVVVANFDLNDELVEIEYKNECLEIDEIEVERINKLISDFVKNTDEKETK